MNTFRLRLVAGDRIFYDDRCELVVFQTVDGEVGFMANHAPAIVAVQNGEVRITTPEGEVIRAVISEGIATCANNRMAITVCSCERPEEIDIARARAAKERAAEQLRQKQSILEYRLSKAALARAMSRLKEAGEK